MCVCLCVVGCECHETNTDQPLFVTLFIDFNLFSEFFHVFISIDRLCGVAINGHNSCREKFIRFWSEETSVIQQRAQVWISLTVTAIDEFCGIIFSTADNLSFLWFIQSIHSLNCLWEFIAENEAYAAQNAAVHCNIRILLSMFMQINWNV